METLPPILGSSVESSVPVTPHGCHCSPSPSARHTYSSFSHSLSNLAASRCRPTPAQRGERRRDTRVPFCYQIRWNNDSPPPQPPVHFACMSHKIKSETFTLAVGFLDRGLMLMLPYINMVGKVHLRELNWIESVGIEPCFLTVQLGF